MQMVVFLETVLTMMVAMVTIIAIRSGIAPCVVSLKKFHPIGIPYWKYLRARHSNCCYQSKADMENDNSDEDNDE